MFETLHLRYLWGGSATYPAGATLGPRVLDDYELVWIIDGGVTYEHDERRLDASPGTLLLTRPGFRETYRWDRHRPGRHAFLHFAVSGLPSDWPDPGRWPVARLLPPGDASRPLFRRLLDDWCDGSRRREQPARRICRLVEALVDDHLSPARIGPAEEATPRPVRGALEWIARSLEDDPTRAISLDELAASVAVTPKHLCRLFARSLGRSPMTTVRLARLERALLLLARTDLSVQETAFHTGFASPYHFSRSFKVAYGVPPTEMRRALASGEVPPPVGD